MFFHQLVLQWRGVQTSQYTQHSNQRKEVVNIEKNGYVGLGWLQELFNVGDEESYLQITEKLLLKEIDLFAMLHWGRRERGSTITEALLLRRARGELFGNCIRRLASACIHLYLQSYMKKYIHLTLIKLLELMSIYEIWLPLAFESTVPDLMYYNNLLHVKLFHNRTTLQMCTAS